MGKKMPEKYGEKPALHKDRIEAAAQAAQESFRRLKKRMELDGLLKMPLTASCRRSTAGAILKNLEKEMDWLAGTPFYGNWTGASRNYRKSIRTLQDPCTGKPLSASFTAKEIYLAHALAAYWLLAALAGRLDRLGLCAEPDCKNAELPDGDDILRGRKISNLLYDTGDYAYGLVVSVLCSCTDMPPEWGLDEDGADEYLGRIHKIIDAFPCEDGRRVYEKASRTPYYKMTDSLWLMTASGMVGLASTVDWCILQGTDPVTKEGLR